jgi:hypothetical protein
MVYLCSSSQRRDKFESVRSFPPQLLLGDDKIYHFNVENPLDLVELLTRPKPGLSECFFGYLLLRLFLPCREDPSIVNPYAFSYQLLQLIRICVAKF